jgi:two-component system CheB/CheR fusion protein
MAADRKGSRLENDSARRKPTQGSFPIVAIGASAGGLEALGQFLASVPPRSGMAFVIVQHLDPTRKGMLVELLERDSSVPVVQVSDPTLVKPDHAYVIPPNRDMSIVHGVLHLLEPIAPRGLRQPIDFFFRSLADDAGERSVGVLLSGMGSDGTLGMRAIHEKAGSTFAQEPATAKFDAMPRAAIDAGVVDVTAAPGELPIRIAAFLGQPRLALRDDGEAADPKTAGSVEKIIGLLRTATGHDFTPYKRSTLLRRIERRMGLHQIADIAQYVRYLRQTPEEAQLLFRELLIGVTSFFRDPEAWEVLTRTVLPALVAARPAGSVLRAWVPACSTGEEAYSLAIALEESITGPGAPRSLSFQIFATDLDTTAVERARLGAYPAGVSADVSPERLRRFFVEEDHGYRIRKDLRDRVVFATQNVLQDAPFTKLDVLSCRNLLIYLTADAQRKLLPLFHYSLRPDGVLFLGSAETVGESGDRFTPFDPKTHIFRRAAGPGTAMTVDFPSSLSPAAEARGAVADARTDRPLPSTLQARVEALLLQRYTPAGVLVSRRGDVLFVSGRTGKFLELPAGKTNWNVLAMARDGLRHEIGGALRKAVETRRTVSLRGVEIGTDEGARTVDVTLDPLDDPDGVLIVFAEVHSTTPVAARGKGKGKGKPASTRLAAQAQLERELRRAEEEIRTTREEAQSAQEELKSANEELQSTNEELQSTNEELTTSKEEMQSMNEELQTLNGQLQAKLDDLSRAGNDMKNLLDSTAIAVLFLDDALNVRRYTPEAATLIKLIPSDVGRPLADLATNVSYPGLYDDARTVLRRLVFKETTVRGSEGRRFVVRIMPYRTTDNRIDGVVITFIPVPGETRSPKVGEP